jgi:Circadian oscillating protein COP23
MSAKSVKSRLNKLKALALPVGMLVLLGNGSAFAGQTNYRTLVSQTDSNGDIIINDEPGSTTPSSRTDNLPRFECVNNGREYTIMYKPNGDRAMARPWANTRDMGGGWSADRRCEEIVRRLESYRPDGLLELQTGRENGYNTLCATTEAVPGCRIVLTVPQGMDPVALRDNIFNNLIAADQGESTAPVNALTGGSSSILNRIGGGMLNKKKTSGGAINLRNHLVPEDRGIQRSQPGVNQPKSGSGRLFKKGL